MALVDREDVAIAQRIIKMRPLAHRLHSKFLLYWMLASPFQDELATWATGSTALGIKAEKLNKLRLIVPPLTSQQSIAIFLDRETKRLDQMVRAKEGLLELVAEKRRTLITRAVTCGIHPKVRLRDSGIPWLGRVPEHWKLVHLKRVLSGLDYGISDSTNFEGPIGILRMGDIQDGEISYSKLAFADSVDPSLLLQKGDLLFNRTNSLDQVGKVGLVRETPDLPLSFASYLVRLRCNSKASPDFLHQLLNSSAALSWARSEAIPAIGQANLNPSRYAYMPIAIPPLDEQKDIISHIATETVKLQKLRASAERTIALLKERRAALITAAVTGQLQIHAD